MNSILNEMGFFICNMHARKLPYQQLTVFKIRKQHNGFVLRIFIFYKTNLFLKCTTILKDYIFYNLVSIENRKATISVFFAQFFVLDSLQKDASKSNES